ncbi:hypothetical protein [Streptacidiphilus sp. PAMC 29251]
MMAANSQKFYQSMDAVSTANPEENLQMRQQIFTISAVDTTNHTVTIDKPLEYDMPIDSTSDGSAPIDGTVYASQASPIVEPVVGVGLENFYMTQPMSNLNQADSVQNYGNMDPHAEMNGIVLKWAVNDWVQGIRSYMTGSHPIVTEEAKNVQIQDNFLDGSWNKGAGGRGYFRGSRVWDSLYADNVTRNLRHFTFQWSASDNVAIGNDIDSDFNLHGGYERRNLIELKHPGRAVRPPRWQLQIQLRRRRRRHDRTRHLQLVPDLLDRGSEGCRVVRRVRTTERLLRQHDDQSSCPPAGPTSRTTR